MNKIELTKEYHDKLVVRMCETEEGRQTLIDVGIIKEDGSYTNDVELILTGLEDMRKQGEDE